MSMAERLVLARQALAGIPLQGIADAERLEAGRFALRALASEVRQELEENPEAPVPFTPAQLEAWARDLHRPEVLAEVLSELSPPPQPAQGQREPSQATEPSVSEASTNAPSTAKSGTTEASTALVSFTRDVLRGVIVGLAVGWLLGHLRGTK